MPMENKKKTVFFFKFDGQDWFKRAIPQVTACIRNPYNKQNLSFNGCHSFWQNLNSISSTLTTYITCLNKAKRMEAIFRKSAILNNQGCFFSFNKSFVQQNKYRQR